MKVLKNSVLFMLGVGLIVAGCKKGDTGPAGAVGAPGSTGPQGQTGSPGTANVIYSKWKVIDSSKWTYNSATDSGTYNSSYYNYVTQNYQTYVDTFINFQAVVPTPEITQGIKDSGLVYFYFKDSTGNGFLPDMGKVNQIDLSNFYKLTTTTNRIYEPNHFGIYASSDTIGTNMVLLTYWRNSPAYYDNNSNGYQVNPLDHKELNPKTKVYIRYIIIPGGHLAGGRAAGNAAAVNFKDYEAVKKYYKIPD